MDAILMGEESNISEPMPLKNLAIFGAFLIANILFIPVAIDGYMKALVYKSEFLSFMPFVMVVLTMPLLIFMIFYEAYTRNIKKQEVRLDKFKKYTAWIFYALIFALISGPLIVRPIMSSYLKSQGYEYCRHTQSALSAFNSPNWAKPSVGCEVWELDYKERDALVEQAKADRHGSRN